MGSLNTHSVYVYKILQIVTTYLFLTAQVNAVSRYGRSVDRTKAKLEYFVSDAKKKVSCKENNRVGPVRASNFYKILA